MKTLIAAALAAVTVSTTASAESVSEYIKAGNYNAAVSEYKFDGVKPFITSENAEAFWNAAYAVTNRQLKVYLITEKLISFEKAFYTELNLGNFNNASVYFTKNVCEAGLTNETMRTVLVDKFFESATQPTANQQYIVMTTVIKYQSGTFNEKCEFAKNFTARAKAKGWNIASGAFLCIGAIANYAQKVGAKGYDNYTFTDADLALKESLAKEVASKLDWTDENALYQNKSVLFFCVKNLYSIDIFRDKNFQNTLAMSIYKPEMSVVNSKPFGNPKSLLFKTMTYDYFKYITDWQKYPAFKNAFGAAKKLDAVNKNSDAKEAFYATLTAKDSTATISQKLEVARELKSTDKVIDLLLQAETDLTAADIESVIPMINALAADYRAAEVLKALRNINARYTIKLYDDRATWEPILSKIRAMIDVR